MNPVTRTLSYLFLALALTAAAGCHVAGHTGDTTGDVVGGGPESELAGEVRWVDARLQEIEVRTNDRRVRAARYDNRTRVVYRQREYPVTSLEPGDLVAMRIQQDVHDNSYTDLIRVRQTVQERGGITAPGSRLRRLDGTVEMVDYKRGSFELQEQSGGRIIVSLPYNARRSDVDRFQQLRVGDYVTVEGRFLNRDRLELEAFL